MKMPLIGAVPSITDRAKHIESDSLNSWLVHLQAEFGEQLKLVGSAPELGEWDVAQAPALDWTDDHVWVADLDLPKGENIHFKVVLLSHRGVIWEPGTDRYTSVAFSASGITEKCIQQAGFHCSAYICTE